MRGLHRSNAATPAALVSASSNRRHCVVHERMQDDRIRNLCSHPHDFPHTLGGDDMVFRLDRYVDIGKLGQHGTRQQIARRALSHRTR